VAHRAEMREALELEAQAQRLMLEGSSEQASEAFLAAAERYRASWELASPTSYGRLVGMLKAAILAGAGEREAAYVREQLPDAPVGSPTAAYALAICALLGGDDEAARQHALAMREGAEPFARAADAITALAQRDDARYTAALRAIVADFEARSEHLTGVAIADTALMLERLAARRDMSARLSSPVLPLS
jgi:hypothetical protein